MQYHLVDPKAPAARSEPLSQKDLMSAAYQVARGMEYLSQKKVSSSYYTSYSQAKYRLIVPNQNWTVATQSKNLLPT